MFTTSDWVSSWPSKTLATVEKLTLLGVGDEGGTTTCSCNKGVSINS